MVARSRVLALALLFVPQLALALGLGDIRLNSRLNAPLDAEIELIGVEAEELATLKARLASRETFARYGLEWPAMLASVTVTPIKTPGGGDALRLRSTEPVTEPFLSLLVEVNWARGRLVREYTVLIDPPTFAPDAAQMASAPVAAPTTGTAERQGDIARPAPREAAPIESTPLPPPVAAAPVSTDGTVTVRPGDTLTGIAASLAGGEGTQRMMVGLFQANPEAFGGNMSVLRSGAVLRVPDSGSIAAISARDASAEVSRQYAAWRGQAGAPAAAGDAADEPGRLRLVPPSQAGTGTGTPDANAAAAVRDLQKQVGDLQGQLADKDRLLELRAKELADLQARLAAAGAPAPAATAAPTPPPATDAVAGDVSADTVTPPVADATTPDAATPDAASPDAAAPDAAVADAPAAVEPAPTPAPAPVAAAEDEGPSFVSTLMGFWYIPVLLLVALAGLFGYRKWKERGDTEFDDSLGRMADFGAETVEKRSGLTDTARLRKPVATKDDESFLVEESGSHERPRLADTGTFRQPAKVVTTADQTLSGETVINLDQGDPLAEADFHMAYGLYDQAADLVRIAIQREPQRRDLKLKLLEVFFVWGNKDQFLATARDLAATRDKAPAGEWDKIVIMGKQLAPEDDLFSQGASVGGAIAGGIDLDLEGGQNRVDYDLLGEPGAEPPRAGVDLDFSTAIADRDPTGEAAALKSEGLDFVLDDPARGGDRSGVTTRQMTQKMPTDDTAERPIFADANDAPTVEQPQLRAGDNPTIRQKLDMAARPSATADRTAELAIDDLGLDLASLDTGTHAAVGETPTMVAGLDARSRQLLEEAGKRESTGTQDIGTGSWVTIDSSAQTGTNPAIGDVAATASMRALQDVRDAGGETSRLKTVKMASVDVDFGATDAFGGVGRNGAGLDLDVGAALPADSDGAFTKTQKVSPEDLALPDLEPVTMSEVGTKLDLARAYMDMGDPDGARSILKEVLQEGSVSQKQEAQRLIDALPG